MFRYHFLAILHSFSYNIRYTEIITGKEEIGKMSVRAKTTKCSGLIRRLTGRTLRIPVIRAGFPYHKSPQQYHLIWLFILLPFSEEDTINELCE